MKKRSFLVSACFLLILVNLFGLSSCIGKDGKPRTADELLDRIDEKMLSLNAMAADLEMDVTYYYAGTEVREKGKGTSIVIGAVSGEYYYYSDTLFTVISDEENYEREYLSRYIYDGGKYYTFHDDGEHTQRLYCEMTREEFDEFMEDDEEIDYGEAKNKEFSHNGDGTWTCVTTGYPEEKIEHIMEYLGVRQDMFPTKVIDIKATMTANEDFCATRVEFELIFSSDIDSDDEPKTSFVLTYRDFDMASKHSFVPVEAEYTKVEHIKVLSDIYDMLDKIEGTKDGKLTLTLDQLIDCMGDVTAFHERDIVEYGENEDGFFYEADSVIESGSETYSYDISYSNGKETYTENGETFTEEVDEDDARYFIVSLINSMSYDSSYVSKIEKLSEGKYRLTFDEAEPSRFKSFYEGAGGKFVSASQVMTVTFKDGKLSQVESEAYADGTVSDGSKLYITKMVIKVSIVYNRYVTD